MRPFRTREIVFIVVDAEVFWRVGRIVGGVGWWRWYIIPGPRSWTERRSKCGSPKMVDAESRPNFFVASRPELYGRKREQSPASIHHNTYTARKTSRSRPNQPPTTHAPQPTLDKQPARPLTQLRPQARHAVLLVQSNQLPRATAPGRNPHPPPRGAVIRPRAGSCVRVSSLVWLCRRRCMRAA